MEKYFKLGSLGRSPKLLQRMRRHGKRDELIFQRN